ncbi:MAG: PTS system mannose/fructose/sorbose family transporter subunit IID [Erysipelotrichaceae bacterium]
MTTNSNKNTILPGSKITKGDFWKVFFRSCTLDSVWNYERQQHLAYCYMMIPILKRVYTDKEEMAAALTRHMEFMACTPHIVTLLIGITGAMEEENSRNPEFNETSISAVKTSLMGPMAGIGDSIFWGTLLTIAIGIGVSFAQQGSIVGPIAFLLIINVPGFLSRYFCLKIGFEYGVKFFSDMSSTDTIQKITKAVSIVGLMAIGAMVATMVSINIPYKIGVHGSTETIQSYIDQIMPCLLSVAAFGGMYYLLGKNIKATRILIGIMVLSCLGVYLGWLG